MDKKALEPLRFPVGRFSYDPASFDTHKKAWIQQIKDTPAQMRALAEAATTEQLNTPYRPGGWTVAQVIHHVADSHMNSMIRFKWALTEDSPMIKAYKESLWAELPDSFHTPVEVSLQFLDALHTRWVILMEQMTDDDWNRTLGHPEWKQSPLELKFMLALYNWHCRHHLGHIRLVVK